MKWLFFCVQWTEKLTLKQICNLNFFDMVLKRLRYKRFMTKHLNYPLTGWRPKAAALARKRIIPI